MPVSVMRMRERQKTGVRREKTGAKAQRHKGTERKGEEK